jgi:spore coat protein U-like protein
MHGNRLMRRLARVALATMCTLFASAAAEAAQCTVSTTSVNFGAYNVFDTSPRDSTGTITLRCNGGANDVRVEIDSGRSAYVLFRYMTQGVEPLFYNLYQNANRTQLWGENALAQDVGDPPNNKDLTLTVYGRIPAQQDVSAGSYTDTVTVTVQY